MTALEKANKLLRSIEPKDNTQKVETATGLALVALAENLGRVAKIAENWAKQPK